MTREQLGSPKRQRGKHRSLAYASGYQVIASL